MINFDEIRKAVAIKHNVLLGSDDPILVTVSLNDLVLSRYVEILTAQNVGHQKALAAALQEHVEQAKATAGRIITDAADYVSEQVRQSAAEAAAQLRQDVVGAPVSNQEVSIWMQTVIAARTTAIVASGIAVFCALVAVAAVVAVLVK